MLENAEGNYANTNTAAPQSHRAAEAQGLNILEHTFSYHSPNAEQQRQYTAIRSAAKHFAEVVRANTPCCADQTAAIRKIREAVMTANAAVALDGISL